MSTKELLQCYKVTKRINACPFKLNHSYLYEWGKGYIEFEGVRYTLSKSRSVKGDNWTAYFKSL